MESYQGDGENSNQVVEKQMCGAYETLRTKGKLNRIFLLQIMNGVGSCVLKELYYNLP
jgi:hypothetical protein